MVSARRFVCVWGSLLTKKHGDCAAVKAHRRRPKLHPYLDPFQSFRGRIREWHTLCQATSLQRVKIVCLTP